MTELASGAPLPTVAIIGTGGMGSRMGARLLTAGYALRVYNRTAAKAAPLAAKGAYVAPSPADAAASARFVLIMVEGDEASRAVWEGRKGLGTALARDAIAIECSTQSMARMGALAEACAARGIRFVEAPVSGSRPQAESGRLAFFAGGDVRDIDEAESVLAELGAVVHRLGAPPAGTAMKLAVNGLLACHVASLSEALGFLARSGVTPEATARVLGDTPVASPISMAAVTHIAAQDFRPLFPIALMAKDLGYLATASGGGMPLAERARGLFDAANKTWSDLNVSAVSQLFLESNSTAQGARTDD